MREMVFREDSFEQGKEDVCFFVNNYLFDLIDGQVRKRWLNFPGLHEL